MGAAAVSTPHIPVLIGPLIGAVAPVSGVWIDGTLGAGGYTKALLQAGAERVIAIDRDPDALDLAQGWVARHGDRVVLVQDNFANLDAHAAPGGVAGVVLDLGVSSMQLDQAERGFSFQKDGPLDMRMAQDGPTAADIVNEMPEAQLADVLFLYGEERASRRIARAIARAREDSPLTRTRALVEVIESVMPHARSGQAHPATRSFQAIRIAVNDEYGALLAGLEAAERALAPGGQLAVVTFHSIEDRMVKRFLQIKSGATGRGSRHAPELQHVAPRFLQERRKPILPDAAELAANPRARSAKLRVARRTEAPVASVDRKAIGMPILKGVS